MVVVSDSATELMVRTVDAQERTEERVMAKARIRGAARTVASAMERTFMMNSLYEHRKSLFPSSKLASGVLYGE